MMKRKIGNDAKVSCNFKRLRKQVPFDSSTWISPSSLRNFFLNDTLVDFLKLHGSKQHFNKMEEDNFVKFIMKKGKSVV